MLVSVKLGNLESSLGKVLEASRKLRVVGRGLIYVVGAKFPSDRSLVELVRAGVKTGGCVCVSLLLGQRHRVPRIFQSKKAHSWASNKGDAGRLLI